MENNPDLSRKDKFSKSSIQFYLNLFQASQFGLVYPFNVALVFFSIGSLITLSLLDWGNFFIEFIEYFLRLFDISGKINLSGSINLSPFFLFAYLVLTAVIYFFQKTWRRKFGNDFKIKIRYQLILIPFVIFILSIPIFYFLVREVKHDLDLFMPMVKIFIIFISITIVANYYYLLIKIATRKIEYHLLNKNPQP